MLPLLRLLPVGGLVLAILISILALTPPEGAMPAIHRVALDARGPLQNREDHPEWRQFFILAALHRAEAVSKLRDLPSAPTKLPEIVVPVPAAPPITITAAVASVPSTQKVTALAPATTAPATAASAAAAPAPTAAIAVVPAQNTAAPAIEEKPAQFASLPLPDIEAPPITITPAAEPPVASTPAAESVLPTTSLADVEPPEASGGEARIAVPLPAPAPAELRKLVGIPVERSITDPAPEEATGSIDAHPGATIPVEIGETSSTELPIVLPPERPPVLRKPKRTPTRAKRPAKPQPAKRMGLLDVWLLRHNQASASSAASPAAQPQQQTQTGDSATAVSGN